MFIVCNMERFDKNNNIPLENNDTLQKGSNLRKIWLSLVAAGALFWALKCMGPEPVYEEPSLQIEEDTSLLPPLQPEENEISLTSEDFAQPSLEQKELEEKKWVEEFYHKLLAHQGEEIYLVYAKGCPMDQVFYCFSYDEMREYAQPLMQEQHKLEKVWRKNRDAIVEGYLIYDHVDKAVLDDQKIKEIIENFSTNPLYWTTRELWKEKLQAFEKVKE